MSCDQITFQELVRNWNDVQFSDIILRDKVYRWLQRINDIPCPFPPIPDGQSIVLKLICGEPKPDGFYRVMTLVGRKVFLFDPLNPLHQNKVVGVSEKAGRNTDELILVTQIGKIVDDTEFSTYPDSVFFCGANGTISNVPPLVGITQQIGYVAKNEDSLDSCFIVEKNTPTKRNPIL